MFPVWADYTVHIIFTDDIVSVANLRVTERQGSRDGQTAAHALLHRDGHSHLFLKPTASAEVIAHEAWHAIWASLTGQA